MKIQVAIVMGSQSDMELMKDAEKALTEKGVGCEIKVSSAHRNLDETIAYARACKARGIRVIIAGAGLAAHLPGVVAAAVPEIPVIGVPIASGPLQGQDALLAIVQMPKGVPVACVAINGAYNAGLLAAKILAC